MFLHKNNNFIKLATIFIIYFLKIVKTFILLFILTIIVLNRCGLCKKIKFYYFYFLIICTFD